MISENELKRLARLKQRKQRLKTRQFLAEGVRLAEEALEAEVVETLLLVSEPESSDRVAALLTAADKANVPVKEIDGKSLKRLTDTVAQQGVVVVARMPEKLELTPLDGNWLYLDQIRDPGNLGTILRTADWFGVENVALSPATADPYNPKVVRAGMGAHFHLRLETEVLLESFSGSDYTILAADVDGDKLPSLSGGKWCLVVGSEAFGISEKNRLQADYLISIPGSGRAESLNVAVATGILLSQLTGR